VITTNKTTKIITLTCIVVLSAIAISAINAGSDGFLTADTTYQIAALGCNATYLVTIENTGDETDTYDMTLTNVDGAGLAVLSKYSVTLDAGQSTNITLSVADSDTVGPYYVNVNATSRNDSGVTDEIETVTAVVEE
jgi:uncharacterized membrane protein